MTKYEVNVYSKQYTLSVTRDTFTHNDVRKIGRNIQETTGDQNQNSKTHELKYKITVTSF